jgi:ubiquitin-conjugating enzyme E2 Z
MNICNKRIIIDIKEFMERSYEDKFINFDKKNFKEIYALIIGPKNTPYENGLFLFRINFTNKYPFEPPKVEFLNKKMNTRIHPNLYSNGKVCLSILNTWPGPKWTETLSLNSILLSIQSLLNENPLNNEPAYINQTIENKLCKMYYDYTTFMKYELLIYNVLNNKFEGCDHFKKEITNFFNDNYNNILNNLKSLKLINKIQSLYITPYRLKQNINYNDIYEKIKILKNTI